MIIPRILEDKLRQMARKFPVVSVLGPRQSGKTTLVKNTFPNKPYVSLEDPDSRDFALNDPRGFLNHYPKGAIFDEIQRVPTLFSYIQGIVDKQNKQGLFILTGSHNFLLLQNITQTLAGRVGLLTLLPFSLEELSATEWMPKTPWEAIFKGLYPRLYDKKITPHQWYSSSYIPTYLERDVRLIKNVNDLNAFQRFLKLCASRTGQLLNLSSLAIDCGIKHNTASSWIGILEASFIAYRQYPYHNNFQKRLVKTPKLYFYDTGLACALMGIESHQQVETHPFRGNLFETLMVGELIKWELNRGFPCHPYFWRDKTGNEIDYLILKGSKMIPVEIKSGQTVNSDFFRSLHYWDKIARPKTKKMFVIYAGAETQARKEGTVVGWQSLNPITSLLKRL